MNDLTAGVVVELSPVVRRILAPNPGLMTGPGTNTYLVGRDEVAVIDPGPDDSEEHLDLVAEAGAGRIRWILVTHTHSDHSPGAAGLKARTGAQMLGYDERDGFVPDSAIGDGWVLDATGFRLRAIHTPGHASNHLCYRLEGERLLFSGDHIMSGSTVVIAPPDGDMAAYLDALEKLKDVDLAGVAPGHGPYVEDAYAVIDQYLSHRRTRESAIYDALRQLGHARIPELVEAVYTDVPDVLHNIARWSVWAHLRKLNDEGRAASRDPDDIDAEWWHPQE